MMSQSRVDRRLDPENVGAPLDHRPADRAGRVGIEEGECDPPLASSRFSQSRVP